MVSNQIVFTRIQKKNKNTAHIHTLIHLPKNTHRCAHMNDDDDNNNVNNKMKKHNKYVTVKKKERSVSLFFFMIIMA